MQCAGEVTNGLRAGVVMVEEAGQVIPHGKAVHQHRRAEGEAVAFGETGVDGEDVEAGFGGGSAEGEEDLDGRRRMGGRTGDRRRRTENRIAIRIAGMGARTTIRLGGSRGLGGSAPRRGCSAKTRPYGLGRGLEGSAPRRALLARRLVR